MTEHEQRMLDWGCPECGGEIKLYDTNPSGNGGKYCCNQCGRDTVWSTGTSLSLKEIIKEMKSKIGEKINQ